MRRARFDSPRGKDAAGRPGAWELFAAGLAVGGTGVWALSAASRVGVLRLLLEIFPRGSWDAVTWTLIPVLLLMPVAVQGAAVAVFAGTASAWAGTAWAAAAGSGAALGAIGVLLLVLIRHLPHPAQTWLDRGAPEALIVVFTAGIATGWLVIASRTAHRRPAWRAPVAAIALTAAAWIRAHHAVIALSYVLDRPEVNAFFAAVALGGGAASAWAASCAARTKGEAVPAAGGRRKIGATHGV